MVSYGRRPKGRPRAIPFHSVDTEQEAKDLVVLHCAINHRNRAYYIRPTWADQDLPAALAEVRKQFGLV